MPVPEIDVHLASELVAAQFPRWADLSVRPIGQQGHDNRTFRLGDDLSIRLPSAEQYAAQVLIEHHWLPVIAAGGLPLAIPEPVALGAPNDRFPWPWSIRRWLAGEAMSKGNVSTSVATAKDLAAFLRAFQHAPTDVGPRPGPQNFHRGARPAVYDGETLEAISELKSVIDAKRARAVWAEATAGPAPEQHRWVHGDIVPSNLLCLDGRLHAVIDFGCMAVGDPACDLAIAWTAMDHGVRSTFFRALNARDDMVARARGWALWKALVILREGPQQAELSRLRFGWAWPVPEIVSSLLDGRAGTA